MCHAYFASFMREIHFQLLDISIRKRIQSWRRIFQIQIHPKFWRVIHASSTNSSIATILISNLLHPIFFSQNGVLEL
uniref:Uncharacterized protein n=1 Tax=Rhizophora mucronata TaxID=61149 RepID=A0A2P2MLE2_RHIMU